MIGDQARENQKDIIVCGLTEDFLIKRTSFISHLLPRYFHLSKMSLVKKYSPLLTVVLYPRREDHCIKQRHLSQFLHLCLFLDFFSDESHDKTSDYDEAIFKSTELWLGGEKLFACGISTQLGDQERTC